MITLQEVSSPGCHICKTFEEWWHRVEKDFANVNFEKIDVTTPLGQELAGKHMIFSSPGIIINDELFSTGGFNKEAVVKKLKELNG